MAPSFESKGDAKRAARYRDEAAELARRWLLLARRSLPARLRGRRRELTPMSAMTASWPVLSGAVDAERGRETIENALSILARPNRILLVTPPYNEHSSPYPGRSAEYPPGVRENGGQYSHGVSWFVDALSKLAVEARARRRRSDGAALFAHAFKAGWRYRRSPS